MYAYVCKHCLCTFTDKTLVSHEEEPISVHNFRTETDYSMLQDREVDVTRASMIVPVRDKVKQGIIM